MTVRLNAKVAELTDSFIQAAKDILDERLLKARSDREKTTLARYRSEQGFDQMATRMRRLKYENYANVIHNGIPYLYGKTRDIIVDIHGVNYNVGPYHVFLPHSDFIFKQITYVHFVWDKDKMIQARHLHHYAGNNIVTPKTPLDMEPNTCWGNVGWSLEAAIDDCDIADAFRIAYIFLNRLNFGSPLASEWARHAVRLGERL